jgi:hypothetical protein
MCDGRSGRSERSSILAPGSARHLADSAVLRIMTIALFIVAIGVSSLTLSGSTPRDHEGHQTAARQPS